MIGLSRLSAAAALVLVGGAVPAADALTSDQANLAYCHVVLSDAAFGGLRPGEDDPGSAAVLMQRLGELLKMPEEEIVRTILPPVAATVAKDMAARQRPRFSPTACAGYAHFIKTQ
jgi:hypothetical protein